MQTTATEGLAEEAAVGVPSFAQPWKEVKRNSAGNGNTAANEMTAEYENSAGVWSCTGWKVWKAVVEAAASESSQRDLLVEVEEVYQRSRFHKTVQVFSLLHIPSSRSASEH